MVIAANLGFPRIGAHRELKKALESFWKGETDADSLMSTARDLRAQHWKRQQQAGIGHIPSNDFSFYDQILDHLVLFGAVPARYAPLANADALTRYFAMARGHQKDGVDVVAMEMSKWFDTNYHYIVPEYDSHTRFSLVGSKPVDEFLEAKALGIHTRPVIVGPMTLLAIGKRRDDVAWEALLDHLLPAYESLLKKLEAAGADWVQIDEPKLVMDLCDGMTASYKRAYERLSKASGLKLCLATYFDGLRDNTALACSLPVDALHIDLVRAPEQLSNILAQLPASMMLSVGVVDGRNIWKTDLDAALETVKKATDALGGDRVMVAPSCSLLHVPVDLENETKLDNEIKSWMAFAAQKLDAVAQLANAANGQSTDWSENRTAMQTRKTSKRIHNDTVKARLAGVKPEMLKRKSAFPQRIALQQKHLNLPLLPTTTIGSFPQTADVRQARADFKAGRMSAADYQTFLESKTADCIAKQDAMGLDVPVHGEFERNDMVEYFGEQLDGYAFTANGWVQSYGSRCVKPPVIFGDVSRPKPMTVAWATFAQSKTSKPMKGMLTGPVTILQWSFVRDDQPRAQTCKQIGLAIRDEVMDLEAAGIKIIQIDEAAIREGLPLRKADATAYLEWAVEAFRLCSSGVKDETQIHTHMCYSEFNDIIEAVAKMDADVISIETSRSAMELLDAFVQFKYPNQIGPGVYDIHSPRVPSQAEMEALLTKALEVLKPEQIWVNPDCGLKTRGWPEVDAALKAMVAAAAAMRPKAQKLAA